MKSKEPDFYLRVAAGVASVGGLVLVFVFQHFSFAEAASIQATPLTLFFINRTARFLLNDALAIVLIWSLFNNRRYVIFAIWVQVFGLVFFLLPYFMLKAWHPGYDGPLVSFMHRLVLNPTLLLLLIPAFYYQSRKQPEIKG
ncbi:MAG: exosortase F system-associated protein [Cyclobacteriaceae bacterium]|nr:exosortase F system-associated protein [Cyclobacteriaceae bacterium]